MRERSFQFFELLGPPMHFDTGQTRHLQHFLQQRADIVQMSKQAVGAFVRFAAENLVLVNAEHIEKLAVFATKSCRIALTASNLPAWTLK